MQKRQLVLTAFGIAVLALAPAALAKGAESATVTGPGLAGPLKLISGGSAGTLGRTAYAAGFFDAVFGRSPDARPKGDLGPKYQIAYVMPGPQDHVIRQDVYPYASSPVTYIAPGQPIWGGQEDRRRVVRRRTRAEADPCRSGPAGESAARRAF